MQKEMRQGDDGQFYEVLVMTEEEHDDYKHMCDLTGREVDQYCDLCEQCDAFDVCDSSHVVEQSKPKLPGAK